MLDETFYLDGVSAESVGIRLQSPIEFSAAEPIYETQTVPGRNGTLSRFTGAYKNRTGKASCFCLQEEVEAAIADVGRFLTQTTGYRRLETTADPNHYWLARVKNSPKIDMRCGVLAPFDISFDCKPQRFLKSGDAAIKITQSATINNPYGQIARPLLKITGRGSFTINDWSVFVSSNESLVGAVYLDCETQNAYNDDGGQNKYVTVQRTSADNQMWYDYPALYAGENTIKWTIIAGSGIGIEEIEIIPRWWDV